MAEGQAQKPKRARSKQTTGSGIIIIQNRFVCNYSGRILEKAVVPKDFTGACFANLPCAKAWLAENITDTEEQSELWRKLCEQYEQVPESIPLPMPREQLADFGGDESYASWAQGIMFWDTLTEATGVSCEDYQATNKKSRGGKGKPKVQSVSFTRGMWVISHKQGAPDCKMVDALDGAVEKGAAHRLTPAAALAKLRTFSDKHPGEFKTALLTRESCTAIALMPDAEAQPAMTLANHVATQLLGSIVFGPCVVVVQRKITQKI